MSLILIILLVVAHFFGDWIMQPRWMANDKSSIFPVCLFHGLITGVILAMVCGTYIHFTNPPTNFFVFIGVVKKLFILIGCYGILHTIQDWYIWRIYKRYRNPRVEFQDDYWFYSTIAIDQTTHLTVMFSVVCLFLKGMIV